MATTRRKPAARRSSRKPAAKKGGHSLSYLVFGVILGLALAAFLTYYIKSSPTPFAPQITQSPAQPSPQAPLTAPKRPAEQPVVVQTAPSTPAVTQPSTSGTTGTAGTAGTTASTPSIAQSTAKQTSQDPLAPILDPNTGLVTTTPPKATAAINPDALIKTKPEAPKSTTTTSPSASTTDSQASTAATTTATKPKPKVEPKADPKAAAGKEGSGDAIGALIQAIPEEKKAPQLSSNVPKTPLRIDAPAATTATNKGTLLSPNASASTATKPAAPAAPAKIQTSYLQVGSFANFDEADATRARMLLLGFSNVSISKTKVNNREFNRVRIGPFNDEQALKNSQQKLQSANIKAAIVR